MRHEHGDLTQRQHTTTIHEPPPVTQIRREVATQVGLHRPRMIPQQGEEAPYSPEFSYPAAMAYASNSAG